MPELPEVETTCRGIRDIIVGSRLDEVIVRNSKLRWPVPKRTLKALQGERIQSVSRRAKYILVQCESTYIMIHLGMSGRLCLVDAGTPHEKHDHLDFRLDNEKLLRFTDPRRFGSVLATKNPDAHERISSLGLEPLSDAFNGHYLKTYAKNRRISVKSFLMDGHVVVGIGNIYASESLYEACIHPSRVANSVSLQRYEQLALESKKVLSKAIAAGGTTLKDFVNGNGKPGYFQQTLQVYGRKDEPCYKCGKLIKSVLIAQRTSYYCPQCQR